MAVAGVLLRAYLVVFTEGTYDVSIWSEHARGVLDNGLVAQYRASTELNHPPLACWVAREMLVFAQWTGLPFRIVLRAPIALMDLGTAILLGYLLRKTRYLWVAVAGYAVHPLAVILSAYHGNTDSLVGFFVVLSLVLVSGGRPIWAGVAMGLSFWVKLPGLLVIPALALAFATWRERFTFGIAAVLTGALTFVPVLVLDPGILFERVFGYRGLIIQTTAGIRVWGLQNFLGVLGEFPPRWQPAAESAVYWLFTHNRVAVLVPLAAFAWLRRGDRTATGLGTTLAGSYAMVYAFSNNWSFQYFAWSIPLWLLAGPVFLTGATLLASGYIYALYAFDCGNPFLLGAWDFVGHPHWPRYLLFLRDAAVLFFLAASFAFLARAAREEWRRFRRRRGSPVAS